MEFDEPAVLLANSDSKFSQLMAVGFDSDEDSLNDSLEMLTNGAWV